MIADRRIAFAPGLQRPLRPLSPYQCAGPRKLFTRRPGLRPRNKNARGERGRGANGPGYLTQNGSSASVPICASTRSQNARSADTEGRTDLDISAAA